MSQDSNAARTSDQISATNFSPREWPSMDSLREGQGRNLGQGEFEEFLATYDLSRKEFCAIFGIGESTLSGWLTGKGLPAAVTHALRLAEELDLCIEQLRQMASALDAAEYDMRVVKDDETYSLVQFAFSGNDGTVLARENRQPVGAIVARDIPDRDTALALARSQSLLRTLKRVRTELVSQSARPEHFGYRFHEEVIAELDHQLGGVAEAGRKDE
jgi:DNA-binding transcriptional regulator YiaG